MTQFLKEPNPPTMQATDEATRRVAPVVGAICAAEGCAGHGLAATMRLERAGAAA